MKQDAPQLDYGVQPRPHRWWLALVVVLALMLSVAFERLSRPLRIDYRWERHIAKVYRDAIDLVPPVNALVYKDREDHLQVYVSPEVRSSGQRVGWHSREADRIVGHAQAYPEHNPFAASLHIGERTSRSGFRRLIVVTLHYYDRHFWPILADPDPALNIWFAVLDEFDWRGNPKSPPVTGTVELGTWPDPRENRTRFYVGAADSDDASRFSIRYEIGNDENGFEEGFIDGRLEDDLTVTLTIRDGPLGRDP